MNPLQYALILCVFLTSPALFALSLKERQQLYIDIKNSKVKKLDTWRSWINKKLPEKIAPASKALLTFLQKDCQLWGLDATPKAAHVQPEFQEDLLNAISELPPVIQEQLQQYTLGIFLTTDLGSTAFTDIVNEFDDEPYGWIALDVDALSRKANEWATWKARSPFSDQKKYQIQLQIEEDATDNRKQAIQYILLHEFAHIIGPAIKAHPKFSEFNVSEYPYSKLSWISNDNVVSSIFDDQFKYRKYIRYYKFEKSQISSEHILQVYKQFQQTSFASLYGGNTHYDDFAEAYTMYVHVILQQKPWKLTITQSGKTVFEEKNPILKKRLLTKKKFFDNLFSVSLK